MFITFELIVRSAIDSLRSTDLNALSCQTRLFSEIKSSTLYEYFFFTVRLFSNATIETWRIEIINSRLIYLDFAT